MRKKIQVLKFGVKISLVNHKVDHTRTSKLSVHLVENFNSTSLKEHYQSDLQAQRSVAKEMKIKCLKKAKCNYFFLFSNFLRIF